MKDQAGSVETSSVRRRELPSGFGLQRKMLAGIVRANTERAAFGRLRARRVGPGPKPFQAQKKESGKKNLQSVRR